MKSTLAVSRNATPAATLVWCGLGLLVPRATLFGVLSPFGIGLAACGGAANLPTLLCLAVGYLLAGSVLSPVRYLAAVALVMGGRWVLAALPDGGRQSFVPPLLAGVACAASGLMTALPMGVDGYRVLLLLTESAVAIGAALCFDRAVTPDAPSRTAGGQAALAAVVAVAVSAAATIQVGGFSIGRIFAALLVLVCARVGRESGGCVAGCVLGGGLALTSPIGVGVAAAYAFGGLMAGAFSRFGRLVQGLLFLLSALLITLTETEEGVLILAYELFCAVVLFCCLPREWERRLSGVFRRRDTPAAEGVRRMTALRLQVACGAMEEVSRSVETVARRLSHYGAADLGALYRGCATAVCGNCPMRAVCWELKGDMPAALEALTPRLQQEGTVTAADLQDLPISCRRVDALAAHLTAGYGQYLVREAAWRRLEEIQRAAEHQLDGTAALLRGLVGRLQDPNGVDMPLSEGVLRVCEDYGLAVEEALCTRDDHGRITVTLLTEDSTLPEGKWVKRLGQVCGCTFGTPKIAAWGESVRVTLTEPPRYAVESGIAQHTCRGETLCGDTAQVCDLEGGVLALISDGMGSGGRAAVDSAMASGIARRLWQAGFPADAILQTVNASLLVKSREETLATLDVAQIDTHTGGLRLYKAGAATTLLRSGGRIARLERTGLPLGILPEVRFERSRDTLSEGDILLMVSDGALSDGLAAVEELLAAHPAEGSMAALAQAVADAATAAQHPDDVTVIALRLCRVREEE